MIKLISVVAGSLLLAGCESVSGGVASLRDGINYLQTSPVQEMGDGSFYVESQYTRVAIKAGQNYCAKQSQQFVALKYQQSNDFTRGSVWFRCE